MIFGVNVPVQIGCTFFNGLFSFRYMGVLIEGRAGNFYENLINVGRNKRRGVNLEIHISSLGMRSCLHLNQFIHFLLEHTSGTQKFFMALNR